MNKLKNIISVVASTALLISASLVTSCNPWGDLVIDDSLRDPFVKEFSPLSMTNTGLDVGTPMDLIGYSLDKIGRISISNVVDAEYTVEGFQLVTFEIPDGAFGTGKMVDPLDPTSKFDEATMTKNSVEIPNGDYAGQRYQEMLYVFDKSGKRIYQKEFFVNRPFAIPTFKALYAYDPAVDDYENVEQSVAATIGDELLIQGYLLDEVTAVKFGDVLIYANDFVGVTSAYNLVFAVPNSDSFTAASNSVAISLVFAGGETVSVSESFSVVKPAGIEQTLTTETYYEPITITGENLDFIDTITFASVECEIVSQTATELVYMIPYSAAYDPAISADQVVAPVYANYGVDSIKICDSFTLQAPAPAPKGEMATLSGTNGDSVTVNGYFLNYVTSITFGTETVSPAAFTEFTATTITFPIPDVVEGTYSVTLNYAAGSTVVADNTFAVVKPAITTYTTSGIYNSELTIEGTNLDLVNKISFSGAEATIISQTATEIKYSIPFKVAYDVAAVDEVVTDDVKLLYGDNNFEMAVGAFALNVTALDITISDIAIKGQADINGTTNYGLYLNSTMTFTGSDLDKVSTVMVGDIEAEITSQSATEMVVAISDAYEFYTATEVNVVLSDDATGLAKVLDKKAKIYPFYIYENIEISGRNDISRAAFSVEKEGTNGRAVSTDEMAKIDPFMFNGTSKDWPIKSEEDYYSVDPYFIVGCSSSSIRFQNPYGAGGTLGDYLMLDGTGLSLNDTPGTPSMKFDPLDGAAADTHNDKIVTVAVLDRTIENPLLHSGSCSSSSPSIDSAEGKVFAVGYLLFEKVGGSKKAERYKTLYMDINKITKGEATYDAVVDCDILCPKYTIAETDAVL